MTERSFEERERDSAARSRRIREMLLEYGAQPKGDNLINPQKKRTAHEFYRWMSRSPSVSIHAGAYLGNMEREEHLLGDISYPEDHPRRSHVESGQYYPGGLEFPNSRSVQSAPRQSDELRNAASQALTERPRTNRVEAACANCGQRVAPGEGQILRRSSGYVTIHKNES